MERTKSRQRQIVNKKTVVDTHEQLVEVLYSECRFISCLRVESSLRNFFNDELPHARDERQIHNH